MYSVIILNAPYMQCNGKEMSWQHIMKRDNGADTQTPGLSMVPKLKYEHLHLTNFSKMRVDLAAQVHQYR